MWNYRTVTKKNRKTLGGQNYWKNRTFIKGFNLSEFFWYLKKVRRSYKIIKHLNPQLNCVTRSGWRAETRISRLTLVSALRGSNVTLTRVSEGLSSTPWCGKWGWQWLRPPVAQMLSITICSLTWQSQLPRPQVLKHLGMTRPRQTLSITLYISSAGSWGESLLTQSTDISLDTVTCPGSSSCRKNGLKTCMADYIPAL